MNKVNKVTNSEIKKYSKQLGVNLNVVSINTLKKGIKVELEHGKRNEITNITNDSVLLSMIIALAHLEEYPNYYEELEKMEKKLDKQWKNKKKPNIFIG